MQLQPVRHLWGVTEAWESVFPKIKALGYSHVEIYLPEWSDTDKKRLTLLTRQHGFGLILQGLTVGTSVREHLASLRGFAQAAKDLNANMLNTHSGLDAFSDSEADAFYSEVVEIEKDLPFPVVHETHRGRVFFSPWRTRDVLLKFPSLKLCVDFSHWVCVAERLNWDDAAHSIVNLCADRCAHLHCRVGFEEGPQVPDPSAAEYKTHLDQHFDWWNVVWKNQAARGVKVSTFTPEFGPPGYLHTMPHTQQPLADLWNVCEWMKDEVLRRFPKM